MGSVVRMSCRGWVRKTKTNLDCKMNDTFQLSELNAQIESLNYNDETANDKENIKVQADRIVLPQHYLHLVYCFH